MITDRPDGFGAVFEIGMSVDAVLERLCAGASGGSGGRWLPGFDGTATPTHDPGDGTMHFRKDADPCGGTTITFAVSEGPDEGRASVEVTQTDFGDWFEAMRPILRTGWRHIVADIEVYLATGVHPARHRRRWGDLGAEVADGPGGVEIGAVSPDGLAARLGLAADDLLVVLGGAPVSGLDDLATVLRVIDDDPATLEAEVVRSGQLVALAL